jgi:DNA-binding transcriptional MocR family regulator
MHCIHSDINVIIVTMTTWIPHFERTGAPIYVEIADAMQRDIDTGRLKPGEKLPPQRNLAYDIGVTIGTIGRAYALARQRGLVTGEVGRGTYIRNGGGIGGVFGSTPSQPSTLPGYAKTEREALTESGLSSDVVERSGTPPAPGKLRLDSTSASEVGQAGIISGILSDVMGDFPDRTTDYIRSLKPEWQQAGQRWLSTPHWTPDLNGIVPTMGVHAGMMAVIAAQTSPGDRIAFESLTYASLARSANLIGRQAIAVPMAEHGMDLDAFEHVCANQHPKLVVIIPTLQNPTTAIMPADQRERFAAVARKHNVRIVEDNIYGVRLEGAPPPIASFAPDITFHLSGLSKAVAAGIRAGWVSCPPGFTGSIPVAHKMITGGMPFLLAETAARLVLSGAADAITAQVRAEISGRLDIVKQIFQGHDFLSHPNAPFIWLKLPEPWRASLFVAAAREAGMLVDGDDEFRFSQAHESLHRVRIAFSTLPGRDNMQAALTRLRNLMDAGPSGHDTYA